MRLTAHIILGVCLLLGLSAKASFLPRKNAFTNTKSYFVIVNDTILIQKQDDKKENGKEQTNTKKQVNKGIEPEIKQVPQARRQPKPTIIKPIVKVKPIKIVRPKIKKP
ncbi:hypothetical protein [Pedobacter boryungensis]|uniref:Uncharacterized protein n=1 Tax=Pedobacter boryungensis TaxID=869962 RepID=A0ABX2DCA1_9SPHI|nr:hypothetical protein [Pedobacter boryungensis]NQX30784.1 hypothetical protein [Pedobacter boryungensis]